MNTARRVALLAFVCMFFTLISVAAAAAHWVAVCGWSMVIVFLSALALIVVGCVADINWKITTRCTHCSQTVKVRWVDGIFHEE